MVRMQHIIHTSVEENNFDVHLAAWKYFIPFYFSFNKTNYARYGSYYLESMVMCEQKFPGVKQMLQHAGLSAQG